MNTLVCSANRFLPFTALCYSSPYFPTAANEQEVSHIDRKRLTSALKNKVDRPVSSHACSHVVLPKHYNNLCHSACVSTHINQHFLYLSWFWWIMGIIFNIWSWHLTLVWDKTQIPVHTFPDFFLFRRNRKSSLCCRETKLTAAYSNRAEKTNNKHTAIQISIAFT